MEWFTCSQNVSAVTIVVNEKSKFEILINFEIFVLFLKIERQFHVLINFEESKF